MKKVQKKDELDRLAEGDLRNVIALMLWKARHQNPDMSVVLTPKDIKGFRDCVTYLKVKPQVRIVRPAGRPAQEPIPAAGNRRAVAGYPAEPPRPFVSVALVEDGTEDMIRPVENNEEDYQLQKNSEALKRARETAPELANRIEANAATGTFSESEIRDAAAALRLLAQA